jgi:hypothetical protein
MVMAGFLVRHYTAGQTEFACFLPHSRTMHGFGFDSTHALALRTDMYSCLLQPFSAIYIELFYVFSSVWGHKARTFRCCKAPVAADVNAHAASIDALWFVDARATGCPCSCCAEQCCCAQVYTIWSILFIVFIILIIVTAFITIALTYFQLAVEDHRWWWRSFLCGGATGQLLRARFTSASTKPVS